MRPWLITFLKELRVFLNYPIPPRIEYSDEHEELLLLCVVNNRWITCVLQESDFCKDPVVAAKDVFNQLTKY